MLNDPINLIDVTGAGPIAVGICAAASLADAYFTARDLETYGDALAKLKKQQQEVESCKQLSDADKFDQLADLDAEGVRLAKARAAALRRGAFVGVADYHSV